jgi:signal transduction histidine kinase
VKLRSYLAILMLAGVLPLSLLTAVVGIALVRQQRAAVERGLAETASALAALTDNELETSIRSLETLATSQRLDIGNLPGFYEQARRVREHHRWTTIGLIDADGTHRLNLALPLGAPLPSLRDRDYFKQVVATGKPYVSNLLTGRTTGTTDIGVAVPVWRAARLKYVLFAGVDPERFGQLLDQQELPPGAVASIVGRDGILITQSRDHAGAVGRALPATYLALIGPAAHGQVRREASGGVRLEAAYRRMASTGWIVDVGLPSDAFSAPVRRIAWLATLVGGALVLAAFALAVIVARWMARDIEALSSSAARIGQGQAALPIARLRVAELEDVRRFMAQADTTLREREQERAALLANEQTARAEAEALNHAKDQFLAMLSHELRNPLGAIAGAVGVLGMITTPDQRAKRSYDVIARQVQHLSRLVDDLLDVARVTTGKVLLERRALNLAEVVEHLVSEWRAAGRLDQHEIAVETQPVWVAADETRMAQVVGNLVGNALKYTPAGGRVAIRVRAETGSAVIDVEDTGIGIPPHLLATVFDVFVQGDRALDRSQGGLGLGLSLVKALAVLHGGTVEVRSGGTGRGARFIVRLPLVPAPSGATDGAPVDGPTPRVGRRVLLVEDNADAREMLRVALTIAGHQVQEAADGPTGLALVITAAPDVAVIDVGLPGMDGYDVARRIRESERGKTMHLVALTGYGQLADRRQALDAGFDAHLTKPVEPERLLEVIAETPIRTTT